MIDPQVFPFVTAKPPRLEGAAYDNSHIPIKLTYTNRPFLERGVDGKQKRSAGLRFLIELKLFWF